MERLCRKRQPMFGAALYLGRQMGKSARALNWQRWPYLLEHAGICLPCLIKEFNDDGFADYFGAGVAAGGLAGSIHPLLPGMPLMFAGTWLLAYSQDYEVIGTTALTVLGLIMALAWTLDYVAGLLGAKFTGASKQALWGSLAGGVVGLFFALPGMVLGPLIGAAVGEFAAQRSLWAAGKVGLGTLLGFVAGVVAKLGCALVVLFSIFGLYVYYWLS